MKHFLFKESPVNSVKRKAFSLLIVISLFFYNFSFGGNWQGINSTVPSPIKVNLVSSDIKTSILKSAVGGFSFETVETPLGVQNLLEVPDGIPLYEKGAPDLKRTSASLIIPERGNMELTITSSHYKDYENVEIAPSKGVLLITDDISKIPFEYGSVYQKDEFFPGKIAELREAHIMRNVRGQVVDIYPFQYNPVKKLLRVYYDIQIQVNVNENEPGENILSNVRGSIYTEAFEQMYASNYINYAAHVSTSKRALSDKPNGRMLVITHANYKSAIQPFVDWKILKGIETELVDVATIGNAAAIKTYVSNYYKAHADFTYLVLVGDHAQVPSNIVSTYASDNKYTQLDGTDKYPEIICGRISAETVADVQNQVTKFLTYEKNPNTMSVDRFDNAAVASLKLGPDNKTNVYLDMRAIKTTLTGAGYEACKELYEKNVGDAAPTAANISKELNAGIGYMSWISHGSPSGLISFNFTSTSLKQLTNTGMWPMIWNCSCQTGVFQKTGGACFAETWLRANQNGRPTGAIGVAMSTRDMPMGPSEKLGNAAAKLVVDKARVNKTYGGITFDTYVKVAINDYKMAIEFDCMILFGDPSLVVRTKAPKSMRVGHKTLETPGVSNLEVSCDAEGAYVSLTVNKKIIGTGIVSGGKVDVKFNNPVTSPTDTIFVTVTAFDHAPYLNKVLLQGTTSVNENTNANFFSIFPNPSGGKFNVEFNITKKATYTLEVKNALGQLIYSELLPENFSGLYSKQMEVSGKGVYMISLKNNSEHESFKKILVY